MLRQYSCHRRARQGMRKRNWPMRVNAKARKMTTATKIALANTATPIRRRSLRGGKMERPPAAGAASPKGSRPLERLLILGRPGIELVVGRGLFGAVELQDRVSPHFPHAALYVVVLLVDVFAAAQLAFDEQLRALLDRTGELAQLSPNDNAVPLGVRDVLAGLL